MEVWEVRKDLYNLYMVHYFFLENGMYINDLINVSNRFNLLMYKDNIIN